MIPSRVPLFIFDNRVNDETPTPLRQKILRELEEATCFAILNIMGMMMSRRLKNEPRWEDVLDLEDDEWSKKLFPNYTLRAADDADDELDECGLFKECFELATWIRVAKMKVGTGQLLGAYIASAQYVTRHLCDVDSLLCYLTSWSPEVAYFLDASEDIGEEKAFRNILIRDAGAQCWVDDVWRQA